MKSNEKFTQRAELAIEKAGFAAGELGHSFVGTEHLLLGILKNVSCRPAWKKLTLPPIVGGCRAKRPHKVSVAFLPVVTTAVHCGMAASISLTSVGVTISRKSSEALSRRRLTAVAVSYRAMPLCSAKSVIFCWSKRL